MNGLVSIKALDHIALQVKDVEDSLSFYADILGLPTAVSYTHLTLPTKRIV